MNIIARFVGKKFEKLCRTNHKNFLDSRRSFKIEWFKGSEVKVQIIWPIPTNKN